MILKLCGSLGFRCSSRDVALVLALSTLCLAAGTHEHRKSENQQPHVLFIVADDHGWGNLCVHRRMLEIPWRSSRESWSTALDRSSTKESCWTATTPCMFAPPAVPPCSRAAFRCTRVSQALNDNDLTLVKRLCRDPAEYDVHR